MILGYDEASSGNFLPTIRVRDNLLIPKLGNEFPLHTEQSAEESSCQNSSLFPQRLLKLLRINGSNFRNSRQQLIGLITGDAVSVPSGSYKRYYLLKEFSFVMKNKLILHL
jgi:hypothetical protein